MEELFEFDLSDVDVAAFESIATTPPHSTSPTPQISSIPEAPTIASDGKDISTSEHPVLEKGTEESEHLTATSSGPDATTPDEKRIAPTIPTITTASSISTPANSQQQSLTTHLQHHQQQHIHISQQQQQQLQHQVSQIATATGQQPCKILLIPINSSTKQGTQNIKHLIQLPPGASPLTMSALKNASGTKKQVLQFAPKNDNILHQQPQQPPTPTQMIANEVPKRKPCNCTKSQCLKLYCDCFANGEFCSGCNCTNCFNSLSKEKERQKAISQCLERNPEAFRPKIGKAVKSSQGEPAPDSIERRHTKGCNCKRSGCLKNYCECYEAKILCSNLCKCCGCKNYEESFERKTLMQLANSSSESARGILKNLLPTNNGILRGKEFAKSFITDGVIRASLQCLLQSAQQAEKEGLPANKIQNLIQTEMGKCLRMIVDSASESSTTRKR